MKKILIASYYFPPCNIISAQRAQSFADHFKKQGLYPVIVTRHWNGDENSTAGYESENLKPPEITQNEEYTLIQLPYRIQLDRFYQRFLLKFRAGKLPFYTTLYAAGTINPKCNVYVSFHDFLINYLEENPVDYILATAFPMNTIKLGHRLAQKFNKPFIADFRDLWDNGLLAENYRPPPAARLQNFFYEFYLRRWLRSAQLITSVSRPLAEEVKRLAPHAESLVITNGFEGDLFSAAAGKYAPPGDKFVFSVVGTLEPKLDLTVMLAGLKLFLADKDRSQISLNFIGANAVPAVANSIQAQLPAECLLITSRIPRGEAVKKMLESHVLFHAGWLGFKGIASGKIYEYLGAGRNILIAPNDRDVMETLVTETGSGKLADSPERFAEIMNTWFAEWKATGKIEYHGDQEKIQMFTRERQAEKLAREILALK